MQKLSTVFWLFICVKLQCKIPRKKVRKKNSWNHSILCFDFWFEKTSAIPRRRKFVKKKPIVLIFQYVWKTSVDPRRNKKKIVKTQQSLFWFFGMTEKPLKKLWKWGNLDSFLCLELSSNWHQLQVGPLYFCFAFYITANIKRIIAKNKCTFFSTTKKKVVKQQQGSVF